MNNKRAGFTLVEMLVVFLIISVLAGIGIPFYKQYQKRAAAKAMQLILYQCITNAVADNQYSDVKKYKCELGEQELIGIGNKDIQPQKYVYIVLDKQGFFAGFSDKEDESVYYDKAKFMYKVYPVECQKEPVERLVLCN